MELDARGKDLTSQASEAFGKKGSLDSFWQEVAENHYPERADFTVSRAIGEDITSRLYSSEPILFRRDFGNFIGAILRPKGRDWFLPRARSDKVNELTTVRAYLEPRAKTTRSLLYDSKSQFVGSMKAADHDWVTFGNSAQTIEERQDKSGIRFRTWHLRDCAWRENYDGDVDTVFRRFKVKVRNLVGREKAGWKISQKVKDKLAKSPDDNVNCLHIMMPADSYDLVRRRRRYETISLYVDEDNNFLMSEKDVPEFNYAISRWAKIDGSPYAFSPCVVASMPDARTLQTMTWSIIEAGEKAVEPPLVGVNEAVLGGVDIRAGGLTWVDQRYDERTGAAIRALQLGGNPEFGEALRQGITNNLNSAWHLDKLFLPQTGPQMTAEEIMRRHDEFLRSTEPIIDPAETERNGAVLEIVIPMAMRLGYWGSLDEMPKELRGEHVDFSYDNPIEDARKQSKTMAYRAAAEINTIAAQSHPESMAQFNADKAYRDAISGVCPPDWLLSETDGEQAVKDAKGQADASAAAAEAAQLAMAGAKAMPSGAQPQQQAI
jgi:hypothetical protein